MKIERNLVTISLVVIGIFTQRLEAGTWTSVANPAPAAVDTMLLLSDGTVMAMGANISDGCYRLKPDSKGSYVNGTWSTLAQMHDTRLYYSSDVLTNGQVFVAGGEYGTGGGNAEVYDPLNNAWTQLPPTGQNFLDSISKILPGGRVLIDPVIPTVSGSTFIYDPASNNWSNGGALFHGHYQDEASWVKLPDDSILTIDPFGTNSERYIPSLNQWINDADVPVAMYDTNAFELGAGFLLPDGRVFFLGATGNTVFYTPSGNTNMGSWQAGPVIPNGQATPDAPAAMMVNGKILCATSPKTSPATHYPSPTSFYEFDPVANSFTLENGPTVSTFNVPPYTLRMLDLPDGTVLLSDSGGQLYVYQPTGSPLAAGKPAITGITTNATGAYHLTGTLLNGISEGAAYGDDAQMDSNYPLIRMTNIFTGNIYYARTFNWSSTSVMTGGNPESTDFAVPTNVPPGVYSLVVVANGISSDPMTFVTEALQITPTNNIVSTGQPRGPFSLTTQIFNMTNYGPATLNWSLNNTSIWLTVSSASGTLTPGGAATTITASFNANASNLPVGNYSATIAFTNLNTMSVQNRFFSLTLLEVMNGGFETGNFSGWTQSGNLTQNLVLHTSPYIHSGTNGALMAPPGSLGYLSQTLPTTPGQSYLLSFWLKSAVTSPPKTNTFSVNWNGVDMYNKTNLGAFDWTNMQYLITATGSNAVLQFGFQNQLPAYFAFDDVSVTPIPPAVFQPMTLSNNAVRMTWSAITGLVYQVQYATNLAQTNWVNLGNPVNTINSSATVTDIPGTDPQRFYRVLVIP